MNLQQAESFAKVKGLIERLASLRDYYNSFTEADKQFLDGFMKFYSKHYDEIYK